jgi:hypothetical protein
LTRPRLRPRWVLVLANLAACVAFVVLRPPAPPDYMADVAATRATGGIILSDVVIGMLACRLLHPWDEWHGGDALGVKVLEVANAPAAAVAIGVASMGELGLARHFSVCGWSWVLAGVFVATSSAQWWILGAAVEWAMRRVLKRTRLSQA